MQITFDDLLKYCFQELPYEQQKMVEHLIIFDDNYLDIIGGINRIKRELGSKEAVVRYFAQSKENLRQTLFEQTK
ncbi:MAG: hypothetical protein SFU99_09405 [Saprospiraceae bacterium]|nr:hypothetical protein [Saprospiraceae bacterium]